MAREAGILVWYLPLYSPDFNPIEAFFYDLKVYIRRYYYGRGGDELTEEGFKQFLYDTAYTVGNRYGALRGHYRNARLALRDVESSEKSVDYTVLYGE